MVSPWLLSSAPAPWLEVQGVLPSLQCLLALNPQSGVENTWAGVKEKSKLHAGCFHFSLLHLLLSIYRLQENPCL